MSFPWAHLKPKGIQRSCLRCLRQGECSPRKRTDAQWGLSGTQGLTLTLRNAVQDAAVRVWDAEMVLRGNTSFTHLFHTFTSLSVSGFADFASLS